VCRSLLGCWSNWFDGVAAEEAARKRVAICYNVLLRIYIFVRMYHIEGEMSSAL